MKQLQLELNKRLLIVELPEHADMDCPFEILPNKRFKYLVFSQCKGNIISRYKLPDGDWKVICKGPDFTEDIAKGFLHQSLHTGLFAHYVKDIPVNTYCYKTALEAFDAVIYAYGYHWGENPVKTMHFDGTRDEYWKAVNEAESRTFNPSKCIIFEILKP